VCIDDGELCVGPGAEYGTEGGVAAVEGVLGAGGRAAEVVIGLVNDGCSLPRATGGGSFDLADTMTRVPTLPADEPDEVVFVFDGLVHEVALPTGRNALLGGIAGTTRAP
jgi:hypothetical protein